MVTALLLPSLLLIALAILIPRGLERLMPESLGGLLLLGLISALLLWALSALGFALLYRWGGAPLARLWADGGAFRHFLWLGLRAGLIWAPVLVLAVSTAPRRWRQAQW